MQDIKIRDYDEAVRIIEEAGILPLAPLIPNHPSLSGITAAELWHTDTELDPWKWRVRFPADGTAAYGKFIKKKAVFISSDLFPYIQAIVGSENSLEERYNDGLISKEMKELFSIIKQEEGIETRALRAMAGMKDKEWKKPFDKALLELQGSFDIVIAGVKEKTNEAGEINGWSSTSYETAEYWMNNANISKCNLTTEKAKRHLYDRLAQTSSPEAMVFFGKIFKF
ncbi:hypothetical protein KHA94_17725 [Bacillus sp. FJAT-49705]|uniref:Uncharacterized protein n=1 Tax=Cytobacillus citreus TaxID=2833586 RepID=A0ABS5NWN3_9BACI|nr:hypothetical protein [Cytobacillus citreus]MBS4192006.1 hypothetical protein [Cytobacillus citreus]